VDAPESLLAAFRAQVAAILLVQAAAMRFANGWTAGRGVAASVETARSLRAAFPKPALRRLYWRS
jgi:hypothetical protein